MGSHDRMLARIDEKIEAGFRCIKLKIGGIRFDEELKFDKSYKGSAMRRRRLECVSTPMALYAFGRVVISGRLPRMAYTR